MSDSASQFFIPFQLQIITIDSKKYLGQTPQFISKVHVWGLKMRYGNRYKLTYWIWTIHGKNTPVLFDYYLIVDFTEEYM